MFICAQDVHAFVDNFMRKKKKMRQPAPQMCRLAPYICEVIHRLWKSLRVSLQRSAAGCRHPEVIAAV